MTRKWWVLFVGLVLQMVVNPCMASQPQGYVVAVNTLAVLTIIYTLSFHWVHLTIGALLGIPVIVFYWINTEALTDAAFLIVAGVLHLYALFVCVPLLLRIKRAGWDELLGAMSLYLLIGITWAILYLEIEFFNPGSFSGATNIGQFVYFSFITLTTLGYGDITPLSCEARVLTSLEAVLGVFCLAIVVSRLIALSSIARKS